MEQVLYAEADIDGTNVPDGYITKAFGNMETFVGTVTNYDAKVSNNGSFECMLEITSKNSALLGNEYEKESQMFRRIKYCCENLIFDHALSLRIKKNWYCSDENGNDLNLFQGNYGYFDQADYYHSECEKAGGIVKYIDTPEEEAYRRYRPNSSTSAHSVEEYNRLVKESVERYIESNSQGNNPTQPASDSVLTGVWIYKSPGRNKEETYYISWGVVEDLILNPEFGFGENTKDINEGNNFQIRLDSSNSFTIWNASLVERQRDMLGTGDGGLPKVIFPFHELGEYGYSETYGWDYTYSTETGKSPDNKYYTIKWESLSDNEKQNWGINESEFVDISSYDKELMLKTKIDLKLKRIPLREVFIKADEIYRVFQAAGSVPKSLGNLLKLIKDDTYGLMDLRIINNGDDTKLAIIDNNQLHVENREKVKEDVFENLFEFKVMSPDTIVNEYNLSFTMPQGTIGNVHAIKGMAGGDQLFAATDLLDTILSLEDVENGYELFKNKFIAYLPEIGASRYKKLHGDTTNRHFLNHVYDRVDSVVSGVDHNPVHGGMISPPSLTSQGQSKPNKPPTTPILSLNVPSEDHIKILETITINLQFAGALVANNKADYYRFKSTGDFYLEQRATPLPLTLSFKIYGISSLVPGDIVRMDYLPKKYRDNVYFQIMTVAHNIDSGGWYTTLETQFRIRTKKKKDGARRFDKPRDFFYANQYLEDITNVPTPTILDKSPPEK